MNDKKILIVEDELIEARSIENLLRRFGYTAVSSVSKGRDAIAHVTEEPPDLILMDIKLRNTIDGIEAAERILKTRHVPIIYITAYSDDETITRAKSTEPFAYLTKPVNELELRINIEMALYKSQIDRKLRENEERYRSVVESLHEGIVVQESSGKIVTWNAVAEEIFGLKAEDIIGHTSLDYPWQTIREDGTDFPVAEHPSLHTLRTGEPCKDVIMGVKREGGEIRWISINTNPIINQTCPKLSAVVISFRDITEQMQTMAIYKTRLRLMELAQHCSMDELLSATLDECETLTGSQVGFYHFINENQQTVLLQAWSKNTAKLCRAAGKNLHYPVQDAGVWVDCIHERKPVVHNDYASLPHRKGVPEGHVPVIRELVVPVMRNKQVVAVLGVGNKPMPYHDQDVQVVSLLADLAWDIAECKRAEKKNRETEARYRTLFENTRNAIAVYQAVGNAEDFIFVDFNTAAEKFEQITRDKVIGKSVGEVFPGVREFGLFDVFQRVWLTGMPEQFPVKLYKDNRISGWRDNYVFKLPSGEVVAIYSDETKRKQLEETRERLITAIEQAHEAIVVADTDGTIQYVNAAFEQITGYTAQEAIGQNPRILKSGVHDNQFYETLWQTITSGTTWQGHFVNRRKDGTFYDEEAVISPVRNDQGAIINFVAVKRDVTHELRLEAQLRQAQKMEAIGTLAGGIAHDFNNILGGILNYAQIALDDLDDKETLHESLTWIMKLGDRATDMVRQILTFSRQTEQDKKPVHLQSLVKEALKLLRSTIPSNIELYSHIDPHTAPVLANVTQIHQVLINLCSNAAFAMREQGGRIDIALVNDQLNEMNPDVPDLHPGAYVRLSVSDTGQGIPPEIIDKIFDPFFTTKEVDKGTGLGLAVVHGIVKEHSGTIQVHSTLGKGATFTVFLPAASEKPLANGATNYSLPGGNEHILLIDDEPSMLESTAIMLKKLGYSVTACANPLEALTVFQKNPAAFQLVVTDQAMPKMTGNVLAQEISRLRPELPILLMTGYSSVIDPETIHTYGIKKILLKPVHHHELAQEIRKALDE